MKYLIARAIEGVALNGNEYLMTEDNEPFEFDTREEAQKYIDEVVGDSAEVWEVENVEELFPKQNPPDLGINVSESIKSGDKMGR